MLQMDVVVYKCTKCDTEDHVRFERGERHYPAIICAHCHNGSGVLTYEEMAMRKKGCMPIKRTEEPDYVGQRSFLGNVQGITGDTEAKV